MTGASAPPRSASRSRCPAVHGGRLPCRRGECGLACQSRSAMPGFVTRAKPWQLSRPPGDPSPGLRCATPSLVSRLPKRAVIAEHASIGDRDDALDHLIEIRPVAFPRFGSACRFRHARNPSNKIEVFPIGEIAGRIFRESRGRRSSHCLSACNCLLTRADGRVSRVAKGADCKSAGLRLRRFESYLSHHPPSLRYGVITTQRSEGGCHAEAQRRRAGGPMQYG